MDFERFEGRKLLVELDSEEVVRGGRGVEDCEGFEGRHGELG